LSFNHKYRFPEKCRQNLGSICGRVTGYLIIISNGSETILRTFSGTGGWVLEQINLERFIGSEIQVKFFAQGEELRALAGATSYWYIQDVQILP
jgi:hypothetical protein